MARPRRPAVGRHVAQRELVPGCAMGSRRGVAMMTERSKLRVLVVDDDAAIRMVWALNLELAGFEVLEAEDGLLGLERAREDRPDLVLLDVRMPGLDGFELAQQLR